MDKEIELILDAISEVFYADCYPLIDADAANTIERHGLEIGHDIWGDHYCIIFPKAANGSRAILTRDANHEYIKSRIEEMINGTDETHAQKEE